MNRDWFMKAGQMPIKPPEWSYWIEMKSVKLIEAILLSVDIDPRHVPGRFKRPDTPRIDIPHFQELRSRTEIALNHYRKHAFERHDLIQQVDLKAFRRWIDGLNTPWTLPDQFPGGAADQEWASADMSSASHPKRLDDFGVYMNDLIRRHPNANRDELWKLAIDDAKEPEPSRPWPIFGFAEGEIKWQNKAEPSVSFMSRRSFLSRLKRIGIE